MERRESGNKRSIFTRVSRRPRAPGGVGGRLCNVGERLEGIPGVGSPVCSLPFGIVSFFNPSEETFSSGTNPFPEPQTFGGLIKSLVWFALNSRFKEAI